MAPYHSSGNAILSSQCLHSHRSKYMWRGIINNKTVSSLLFSCSLVSTSLQPHRLYSPPGSSVHEISQARILEWLAISFCRASSPPRDLIRVCCIAGRFFFLFFFLTATSFWLCWVFFAAPASVWLWRAGATLHCGAGASACGGSSRFGAQTLGQ